MANFPMFKVIKVVVRSETGKIIYRGAKGIAIGKPALKRCGKELLECWTDVNAGNMASTACKNLIVCLAPASLIVGSGIISEVIDHPLSKTVAKVAGNSAGLFITGPAYGVDLVLAPIETIIFGSPQPIIKDRKLLLFGSFWINKD